MTSTPSEPDYSPAPSARDELMLDSMGATPNGFEIKTHAGGPETADTLLFIADSMRAMLDEYDAPNYLEMEVKASDGKRYIMNLQRAGKLTPHQARLNAEAALQSSKPRVISTPEELLELPSGSIVLDAEQFPAEKPHHDPRWWVQMGTHEHVSIDDIALPATVLHVGAE